MFLAKKQNAKIAPCHKKHKKLERIYGVRFGNNNIQGTTVGEKNSFTQEDIAQKMELNMVEIENQVQIIVT